MPAWHEAWFCHSSSKWYVTQCIPAILTNHKIALEGTAEGTRSEDAFMQRKMAKKVSYLFASVYASLIQVRVSAISWGLVSYRSTSLLSKFGECTMLLHKAQSKWPLLWGWKFWAAPITHQHQSAANSYPFKQNRRAWMYRHPLPHWFFRNKRSLRKFARKCWSIFFTILYLILKVY